VLELRSINSLGTSHGISSCLVSCVSGDPAVVVAEENSDLNGRVLLLYGGSWCT
jgi:hypothetical protein